MRVSRRVGWVGVVVLVGVVTTADLARPPSRQLSAHLLCAAVTGYQRTLSPVLSRLGSRCRLEPTCSRYAHTCVCRFGAGRGGWLAIRRLLRCGPWTPVGTVDPPPPALAPSPPAQ